MGEPPPPPLLFLLLSLAGRGAAGESSFQQNFPPEEHYRCLGRLWPIPQQAYRVLSKIYQAEDSRIVVDAKIASNQSIPHSGPLRPFGAAAAADQYCSPWHWLRSLKRGGIAFLYHSCAYPSLQRQLALLARACLPCYILTPHSDLTQEWSLALVAWGATLRMAKVELAQAVAWLKRHAARESRGKPWAGRWHHRLMKSPAVHAVGRDVCPVHRMQDLQKLFCHLDTKRRRRDLQASDRQGTEHLPHSPGSREQNLAATSHGQGRAAVLPSDSAKLQPKRRDILEPVVVNGSSQINALAELATRLSIPVAETERGTAQKLACPCPSGEHHQAQGQQLKAAKVEEAGKPVRTPRTEEAAWAASALTFLLIMLTLAVLYTRLHRNCRRSPSLYWTMSVEDGHDTVATVIKRRILSAQSRRKKRPRLQKQRILLQNTSSDSSE